MPTTADLTAAQVMNAVASILNDTARSVYTYSVQIPYLNMALRELQEDYELANMPVTDTVSAVLDVDSGVTSIGYEPDMPIVGVQYLPDDLIEPKLLWERQAGINPFIPMTRVDVLPRYQEGVELNQLIWYTWQSQQLRFLAANQDNQIKMDYTRNLFVEVTDEDDTINVVNAQTPLQYKTAALIARFVEENQQRANDNDILYINALERVEGIGTKGRQAIFIRRRPFRAAYKSQYLR